MSNALARWLAAGWPRGYLVPVLPRTKTPGIYVDPANPASGAGPVMQWTDVELNRSRTDEWLKAPEGVGVGVLGCAFPAVDVDSEDVEVHDAVAHVMGPTPFRARGVRVLYPFRLPAGHAPLEKRRILLGDRGAVEILGDGQQWVGEGVHPSGESYAWFPETWALEDLPEWDEAIAVALQGALAEWVVEAAPAGHSGTRGGNGAEIPGGGSKSEPRIPQGARNDTLFREGCALRDRGYSKLEIAGALEGLNERCDPPLSTTELAAVAASAAKYQPSRTVGEHEGAAAKANGAAGARSLDDMLAELNGRLGLVETGGKVWCVSRGAGGGFRFLPVREQRVLEAPLVARWTGPRGGAHVEYAFDRWLEWPGRREWTGVEWRPSGAGGAGGAGLPEGGGILNLWQGFKVDWRGARRRGCRLALAHIRDVWCGGDLECFEYVLNWLAHLVQRPEAGGVTALVLISGQGAGKGVLVEGFELILGEACVDVTNVQHVLGQYADPSQWLLCALNESVWGGDKRSEGRLKALITDRWAQVERKYHDVAKRPLYTRYLIESNEDWVVPVGADDRRFVFLPVSDARRRDHAYFRAVSAELRAGGAASLLRVLMERDLSGVELRDVPAAARRSEARRYHQERGLTATRAWLQEAVDSGRVPGEGEGGFPSPVVGRWMEGELRLATPEQAYNSWSSFAIVFHKDRLYRAFRSWCFQANERVPRYGVWKKELGKNVLEIRPRIKEDRPRCLIVGYEGPLGR